MNKQKFLLEKKQEQKNKVIFPAFNLKGLHKVIDSNELKIKTKMN